MCKMKTIFGIRQAMFDSVTGIVTPPSVHCTYIHTYIHTRLKHTCQHYVVCSIHSVG